MDCDRDQVVRKILYIFLVLLLMSLVVSADSIKAREEMRKMEKATVERVDISTVDVRLHGKYIANVELITSIDIEMVGLRDVVLVEEVSGKYYLIAIVSAGPAGASERLAEWVPRAPVSLTQTQQGSVYTLSWDWGDSTRMLAYLGNYVVDVKLAGADWGVGSFPLDVGAAKTTTVDVTHYKVRSIEWRVRAVSIYNTSSGWAASGGVDFIPDIEAPEAAPTDFTVESGAGKLLFGWSYDLTEPEDLDGFIIYIADDSSGANEAIFQTVGKVTSASIPTEAGREGYFNIKAVDTSYNRSDFALATWVFAGAGYVSTGQLLVNGDWAVGDIAADTIYDWDVAFTVVSGSPTLDYGAFGLYGSRGIEVDDSPSGGGNWNLFVRWPDSITLTKEPGIDGAHYTMSVHADFYNISGGLLSAQLGAHDGVSDIDWLPLTDQDYSYVPAEDGWWRHVFSQKWEATDSAHKYICVRFRQIVASYPPGTWQYDRPQLELGMEVTPWSLRTSPVATSSKNIRLDTSGIISQGIVVDEDGRITSDVEMDGSIKESTCIGARVYNSANISVGDAAWAVLTFNTERFDTDGIHSTVSNTGRLTATRAGVYAITGHVQFAGNGTGLRGLDIQLNGTTTIASSFGGPGNTAADNLSVAAIYELAATDYVGLRVYQSSGGSLNVNAAGNYSPEFSMVRIA